MGEILCKNQYNRHVLTCKVIWEKYKKEYFFEINREFRVYLYLNCSNNFNLVYNCQISFKFLFHLNYLARNSDISINSGILLVKLICNSCGNKFCKTSKSYKIVEIADIIQMQMAVSSLLMFFGCFTIFGFQNCCKLS